jgi:hypothetical protein
VSKRVVLRAITERPALEPIERPCAYCGVLFMPPEHSRRITLYCSKRCNDLYREAIRQGKAVRTTFPGIDSIPAAQSVRRCRGKDCGTIMTGPGHRGYCRVCWIELEIRREAARHAIRLRNLVRRTTRSAYDAPSTGNTIPQSSHQSPLPVVD